LLETADAVFESLRDRVLAFDTTAANHYADIVVARERAGAPIAGFDAQNAAICRTHGASLATRNIDDFTGLGLDLIDPWLAET
jgi:predicted nucleic acid-binding protein